MSSRETILASVKQSLKGLTITNPSPTHYQPQQSQSADELVSRFGAEFKKIDCEMIQIGRAHV